MLFWLNRKLKSEKGAAQIIVFAVCFVVLLTILVSCIEYFIPVNKYATMKEISRKTLFKVEQSGGLSVTDKNNLITNLSNIGLTNVTVVGTATSKYSNDITFRVEADFIYSKLTLFTRNNVTEHFIYDRTMVQKKVTN